MDITGLQPKFFFGLRTDIQGNVNHISEGEILYPVGGILAVHNHAVKRQKYLKLPEKGYRVKLICVSPNKRYIAVAETGDPPGVSIYDTTTLKRKRHILPPAEKGLTTTEIECISFTSDLKSLLVVYGEPDMVMISYKYDKGKFENMTRANNLNNTGTIRHIAPNPNDSSVVVLVGDVLFRMLAVTDNIWRQYGYSKAENMYFRTAAWISQERLLAGTNDGKLMMVENGEFKMFIKVEDTININFQSFEEMQPQGSGTQLSYSSVEIKENEVRLLQTFPKGFFFECGNGKVFLFEKESPHKFKKRNVFTLQLDKEYMDKESDEPLNRINSMSLSPTQDFLVVTCGIQQLYYVYMWGPDMTRQQETFFKEQGPNLHKGGIGSIAVCTWKPILLTVGKEDRTIRIWNYETMDLQLIKQYQEDIYGITLHPTGLYTVAGFAGKLRFLTILIDDLAVTREFTIRYCQVVSFSKQGHLFAAVNGNVIQIYSSITFENILNLKGHNGKITDVSWTINDLSLLSCGTDGALYEWDMTNGRRIVEVIVKTFQFTGCAITTDGKISYTIGSDGVMREIQNATIRTNHPIDESSLDCLILSHSDMMIFCSGREGTVWSVKLPLSEKPERLEYNTHNKQILHLRLSFDDKFLISCSVDGTLCVWKLVNVMGKAAKIDKDYIPSVDILIPYPDLEEKLETIKDLNLRMCELDREHSYKIRLVEQLQKDKLAEIHEAYREVVDTLKDKNASLENEHVTELHNIKMEIAEMKRNHDNAIEESEAKSNEKLINEYNKYGDLEEKLNNLRKSYEEQLEELREASKVEVASTEEKYKQQIHEKESVIEELKEEIQQLERDHEVIKQQIEDDADREIYEMKGKHEAEVKEEQNINIRLRADNGIFQKKLNASFKEIDELKHTIYTMENDHIKLKNVIQGLEKDIQELKKEITERDETIQGKEKKIYELKKRTQELEKYKFVLDFKITELKAQIEPRERKIHDQQEEIREMIIELENLQKTIIQLELNLTELREKLNSSHQEYRREHARFRQASDVIKHMRNDLHYASGLVQEPNKLKIVIKDMYHRYNADKEFDIVRQEDCEAKNEFSKQRHFLEKTIAGLKQTVAKRYDKNEEKLKLMEDSTLLITEVNQLRNQLTVEQKINRQMESVLGLKKKSIQPRAAQKKLEEALKSREDIRREYIGIINQNEVFIRELKEENMRLTTKLCEQDEEQEDSLKETEA